MNEHHNQAVQILQDQIRDYYRRKVPFRVYHGSTNSTRILTFKRSEMVDISRLNHVLSIDKERRTAIVEPNVPMDKLVAATMKYGLVPPVVPEFPGITVGGAIQGAGAESTSHNWGCFSQTINWMNMLLGNGSQLKVSPKKNSDLFYGTAGAYGSLGLITLVEIKLVPARKYVNTSHYTIGSFQEGVEQMEKWSTAGCDFIEWIMFSKNHGAIVIGTLSDTAQGKVHRFSRAFDNWYYLHVKHIANSGQHIVDSVPLKDYLFRFNRGAFWAAELAFVQANIPFNGLTRFLLDPLLRTRKLYRALQESAASQVYLCQDLVLPQETAVEFLNFVDSNFNMYPIGGCPIKTEPRSQLQCNGIKSDLVFNIGVYGLKVEPYVEFVKANRKIETETKKLGGKKWFYAHNYYTPEEFWQIYDKSWYDELRQKYHATTLPDIYTRTCVTKQYEVHKRRGALKTIAGIAKLRIED